MEQQERGLSTHKGATGSLAGGQLNSGFNVLFNFSWAT